MSDDHERVARTFTYSGTAAEGMRELRNERPEVEKLQAHPYITRVEDVSFNSERELLEVSFRGVVPEPFAAMDEITILTCWIGTTPSWWGTLLGDDRAQKFGLGSQCITALVEVDR